MGRRRRRYYVNDSVVARPDYCAAAVRWRCRIRWTPSRSRCCLWAISSIFRRECSSSRSGSEQTYKSLSAPPTLHADAAVLAAGPESTPSIRHCTPCPLTREQICESASRKLSAAAPTLGSMTAMIGLDGFVDEIIAVVDKRHERSRYEPMKTIAVLGEKILRRRGNRAITSLSSSRPSWAAMGRSWPTPWRRRAWR